MKNTTTIKTVLAMSVIIAISAIINQVSTVQAQDELNTNDFQYTVHITDIIDHFTYAGISNFLSDGDQSFEDIDVFRLVIEDSNYYAVYNNNYDNTFQFAGIYQNGVV
jgi:hypothetical protein